MSAYPHSRLLIDPDGPGVEGFIIRNERGGVIATFATGGVNGKTARDTAIGNLMDASEYIPGRLILSACPVYPWSNGSVPFAAATGGLGEYIEAA